MNCAGAVLVENFWGAGPWKVSSAIKYNWRHNSMTTCIAESKQSLHEENRTTCIGAWQNWGPGRKVERPPPAQPKTVSGTSG